MVRLKLDRQPVGKITDHFRYEEFIVSSFGQPQYDKISQYLTQQLCLFILEPIRIECGYATRVSGGIRDKQVFDGMNAAGYYPSQTTDHSFGDPEVFSQGVGAADIQPVRAGSCKDIFEKVLLMEKEMKFFRFGQVIWEWQKNAEWVHISNPKEVLFTALPAEILRPRMHIGYGLNGRYSTEKLWK